MNSTMTNASSNETAIKYVSYETSNLLKYVGIILLIFGNCGNILSITVLSFRPVTTKSLRFLLIVLAICDTAVLDIGLLELTSAITLGSDFRNTSLSCSIISFLIYLTLHTATYMLVFITFQRVIIIVFPMKAKLTHYECR